MYSLNFFYSSCQLHHQFISFSIFTWRRENLISLMKVEFGFTNWWIMFTVNTCTECQYLYSEHLHRMSIFVQWTPAQNVNTCTVNTCTECQYLYSEHLHRMSILVQWTPAKNVNICTVNTCTECQYLYSEHLHRMSILVQRTPVLNMNTCTVNTSLLFY